LDIKVNLEILKGIKKSDKAHQLLPSGLRHVCSRNHGFVKENEGRGVFKTFSLSTKIVGCKAGFVKMKTSFFGGGMFTAIVIKNREITEKYRTYFNFLWKMIPPHKNPHNI